MNRYAIGDIVKAVVIFGLCTFAVASDKNVKCTPIEAVFPYYPAKAFSDQVQGDVIVSVHVAKGNESPERIELISGDKAFEEATLTAVRKWRFKGSGKLSIEFKYVLVAGVSGSRDVSVRIIPWTTVIIEGNKLRPMPVDN